MLLDGFKRAIERLAENLNKVVRGHADFDSLESGAKRALVGRTSESVENAAAHGNEETKDGETDEER